MKKRSAEDKKKPANEGRQKVFQLVVRSSITLKIYSIKIKQFTSGLAQKLD
jgi:hypothetical protein